MLIFNYNTGELILLNNKPLRKKGEHAPEGRVLVNVFDNEESLGGIDPRSSVINLDPEFHMTPEPCSKPLTRVGS